jgi:MFS family permease
MNRRLAGGSAAPPREVVGAALPARMPGVLVTLAASQFLMTLDSTVMNVSIEAVATDLRTTVTGVQTAIAVYTLVMAAFMILGGKLGQVLGHLRAFAAGLVVFGLGASTTALSPDLGILVLGWSVLEGIGAVLILPAIVALVAGNFSPDKRSIAYGTIAATGATAVAVGPLVGGAVTTLFSWRWVFAGEAAIVVLILVLSRRLAATERPDRRPIDVAGALLSASGLALIVFGVLRSSEWGWVQPRPEGPRVFDTSPVVWLVLGGGVLLWAFLLWEDHVLKLGRDPLVRMDLFGRSQLTSGLLLFFAQFFMQAGLSFTIPLFLAVVLALSPLDTGARVLPLSVALVVAAAGVPRLAPKASPRAVVRFGLLGLIAGTAVLVAGLDIDAVAGVVAVPLVLMGLGSGALASQLGAVTVSAVPDKRSAEVGGLQNTVTNLGASLGTALVGSILIAQLTATALAGVQDTPSIPPAVQSAARVRLQEGVPFVSDAALSAALQSAQVPTDVSAAVLNVNHRARLSALRTALTSVAFFGVIALFFTPGVPTVAVGQVSGGRKAARPAAS